VALLQLCAEEEADALAREELARDVQQIEEEARRVEFLRFFTQPEDAGSCFLELHAGAGGKDAEEWTGMLARVYTRWAERAEFAVQLVDESRDGTLVKKAALRIDG
jgi:peptide chain release factor 2